MLDKEDKVTSDKQPEIVEHRETSCFTYEVRMFVQVLAQDKEEADQKLETDGGFVTQREVFFVDKTNIYSGDNKPVADKRAK